VQIRILGSAAGGGVPQWNCNCPNCRAARKSHSFLSQSSVLVSEDGKNWLLLNASPDLTYQFASFPLFHPPGRKSRCSPITAVILTDGEIDHVTGLLSLREHKSLRLVCTAAVKSLLSGSLGLLSALEKYTRIQHQAFPARIAGIKISTLELAAEKAPRYASRFRRRGSVAALRLEGIRSKRSCIYIPGLPAITKELDEWVDGCHCLLIDGTFWSDREMISLGLSKRTARDMGHVAIDGIDGSLAWLRRLDVPRKIYTHINNSNPILRKASPERRAVERAGIEISYDQMAIRL
jgi:pyrroloquinoline quinone biosynthesis protein B